MIRTILVSACSKSRSHALDSHRFPRSAPRLLVAYLPVVLFHGFYSLWRSSFSFRSLVWTVYSIFFVFHHRRGSHLWSDFRLQPRATKLLSRFDACTVLGFKLQATRRPARQETEQRAMFSAAGSCVNIVFVSLSVPQSPSAIQVYALQKNRPRCQMFVPPLSIAQSAGITVDAGYTMHIIVCRKNRPSPKLIPLSVFQPPTVFRQPSVIPV